MEVTSGDGKLLGYVYMDLYQRPNKFPGAANFPIQFPSMHSSIARIAFVCSFAPPTREGYDALLNQFRSLARSLVAELLLYHQAVTNNFVGRGNPVS